MGVYCLRTIVPSKDFMSSSCLWTIMPMLVFSRDFSKGILWMLLVTCFIFGFLMHSNANRLKLIFFYSPAVHSCTSRQRTCWLLLYVVELSWYLLDYVF